MNPMHILGVCTARIPSTEIALFLPFFELEKQGMIEFRFVETPSLKNEDLAWADILIVQRCHLFFEKLILEKAKLIGLPFVYELDDNFFSLAKENPAYDYLGQPDVQNALCSFVREANIVKVGSEALKNEVLPLNPNVIRHPYAVGIQWIKPCKEKPADAPFVFGFAGSIVHIQDLSFLESAIRCVLRDFSNVRFVFMGISDLDLDDDRITFLPFCNGYEAYLTTLSKQPWDAALAPLLDSVSNRSKTNVKYREYAACGFCGIYSDLVVYNECVKNGATGLLVSESEQAWVDAMAFLITHPDEAKRMGHAALLHSQAEYVPKKVAKLWMDEVFVPLYGKKSELDEAKKLELLKTHEKPLLKQLRKEERAYVPLYTRLKARIKYCVLHPLKRLLVFLGVWPWLHKWRVVQVQKKQIKLWKGKSK